MVGNWPVPPACPSLATPMYILHFHLHRDAMQLIRMILLNIYVYAIEFGISGNTAIGKIPILGFLQAVVPTKDQECFG